jgi:hypothetical protein
VPLRSRPRLGRHPPPARRPPHELVPGSYEVEVGLNQGFPRARLTLGAWLISEGERLGSIARSGITPVT